MICVAIAINGGFKNAFDEDEDAEEEQQGENEGSGAISSESTGQSRSKKVLDPDVICNHPSLILGSDFEAFGCSMGCGGRLTAGRNVGKSKSKTGDRSLKDVDELLNRKCLSNKLR